MAFAVLTHGKYVQQGLTRGSKSVSNDIPLRGFGEGRHL